MDGVFLESWGCLLMRTLASLLRCGECGPGVPWCFPTDSGFWLVLVLGLLMTSCPVNTDPVGLWAAFPAALPA